MSGPKKYLRTETGERIDQPDFEHAAEESQLAGLTQLGDAMLIGPDARAADTTGASLATPITKQFVLEGFAPSYSSPDITIGAGAAILSWRDEGEVEHGAIVELANDQIVTVSTALSGSGDTFGVYVRFNLQDDQFQNRNFWNSLATTPVETARKIATRRVDSVQVNLSAASPGDEWMLLATFVPSGALTDRRQFYFEGAAGNGVFSDYSPIEWGDDTNDRDDDRALYGVKGLRTFVRATQRQLRDIIGVGNATTLKWWYDVAQIPTTTETGAVTGTSLTNLKQEALSRLGHNASRLAKRMAGNLIVDTSNTYDIGEQATPWSNVHAGKILLGLVRQAAGTAEDPRVVIQAATSLMTKILQSTIGGITPGQSTFEFVHLPPASDESYPGGLQGSFAIAVNCAYDNAATAPTNVWSRHGAKDSYLFEFGTGDSGATGNVGFRIFYHNVVSTSPWDNTAVGGAGAWTKYLSVGSGSSGNADLFGDLTTSGDITISGDITASGSVAATGNISTSANVSAVDVVASGDVTATDDVTGDEIVAGTCVVARHVGYVEIASGGGSATITSINGSVGIVGTPSGTSTSITVGIGDASEYFADANSFVVQVSANGYFANNTVCSGVFALPAGSGDTFELFFMNENGSRLRLDEIAHSAAARIYFTTFGTSA